ncbi:MAG: DUF6069 family protein [Microlunatus sp.]|nr:DUF6069 family protein [Microlunatus sp.]
MSQTITTGVRPKRGPQLWRAGTVLVATAVAIVAWLIFVPVIGIDLAVGSGLTAQTIGLFQFIIVSFLAGGAAWALLAICERLFRRRGRLVWRITAWVVLALSLLGPVSMAAFDGVLAALVVVHLAVGSVLILGLSRRT